MHFLSAGLKNSIEMEGWSSHQCGSFVYPSYFVVKIQLLFIVLYILGYVFVDLIVYVLWKYMFFLMCFT